jgi:single-stranded DNA-binding protein
MNKVFPVRPHHLRHQPLRHRQQGRRQLHPRHQQAGHQGRPGRQGDDGYAETYDQFHTIKAFNGLGKSIANHKKKGDKLIVTGEIRYTRNEKDGRTYYNTEIVADEIEFI